MSTNLVVVYADLDFQGRSQRLLPGRYDTAYLAVGNDVISSIRVPSGWSVTLFEHAGFQGLATTFSADAARVDGRLDDRTSSLVVEAPVGWTLKAMETLYAELRATALARLAALGRYSRADFFTNRNFLGTLGESGWTRPETYDSVETPLKGLLVQERDWVARAAAGEPGARAGLEQIQRERWRVAIHDRENPHIATGIRLAQLAIEHHLGEPSALRIIQRILASMAKLCKFGGDFAGYMLRYDPGTYDEWETEMDEGGTIVPRSCHGFLTNTDPRAHLTDPYLYSPPLDDPRYLSSTDEIKWHRFRRAEPSMDEVQGMVFGYSMVFRMVEQRTTPLEREVCDEVRRQARNLGNYLAEHAYLLVRPGGGFCRLGASGLNPAFEYVIEDALGRITGESYRSRRTFWQVMEKAGVAACLLRGAPAINAAIAAAIGTALGPLGPGATVVLQLVTNALGGPFIHTIGSSLVDQVIQVGTKNGLEGSPLGTFILDTLIKLKQLQDRGACLDVQSAGARSEFAVAYVAMLDDPKVRFEKYMAADMVVPLSWAEAFKPFLSLITLDSPDQELAATVQSAYMSWYERRFADIPVADIHDVDDIADPTEDNPINPCSFVIGVAALLGDRDRDWQKLSDLLRSDLGILDHRKARNLALREYEGGKLEELHDRTDSAYGYLIGLAFAWWIARRRRDRGESIPADRPDRPTQLASWPRPVIPAHVIEAARAGDLILPLHAIQREPLPKVIPADGIDLFADPPPRPATPYLLKPHRTPVVVANSDGRLELFCMGSNDRIWHRWQTVPNGGWSEWDMLAVERTVERVDVALNRNGSLELFAIGRDHAAYHQWQVGGGWSPLQPRPGGGGLRRLIAAQNQDGRVELFGVVRDSGTYHCWQLPGGGWSGWERFGDEMDELAAARNRDGRIQLFALVGGNLWTRWQTAPNGGWNQGALSWTLLEASPQVRRIAVGQIHDGRLEVFAIAHDGAVVHLWQTEPSAIPAPPRRAFTDWIALGDQRARELAVASNVNGRIEVFAVGEELAVWHRWQTGPSASWSHWERIGQGGPDGRVSRIAAGRNRDGRLELFAIDVEGGVWHSWQSAPSAGPWSAWQSLSAVLRTQIPHVDVTSSPHADSTQHVDVTPVRHGDTAAIPHGDGMAVPHVDSVLIPHVDQSSHADTAPRHTDIPAVHADTPGVGHGDFAPSGHFDSWGPHADSPGIPHVDNSTHVDVGRRPFHTDSTSHADTPAGSHGDVPGAHADGFAVPHGDTREILHVDTVVTPHSDSATPRIDTTTHADTPAVHGDSPAVHGDTAAIPHADIPAQHVDTTTHADIPAQHVDTPAGFGGPLDRS